MKEAAGGKVVIVEDNKTFRGVLRARLSSHFPLVEVHEAEDLQEGAARLQEHRPHAVFLDVRLPDGNGLDLAKRVRDELPETCIFICTSHDLPEYRDAAARCGASKFFSKQSLDWDEVATCLEKALRRRAGHA